LNDVLNRRTIRYVLISVLLTESRGMVQQQQQPAVSPHQHKILAPRKLHLGAGSSRASGGASYRHV